MSTVHCTDLFQKYEDEKSENDRLRKELEETKASLRKAKEELDAAMKHKDLQRNSERVSYIILGGN